MDKTNSPSKSKSRSPKRNAMMKAEEQAKKLGVSVVEVKEHPNGSFGAKFSNGIYRIVQSSSSSASTARTSPRGSKPLSPLAAVRAFSKYYNKKPYASETNRRRSMKLDLCRSKSPTKTTVSSPYRKSPIRYDYPGLDDGSQCKNADSFIKRLRSSAIRRSKKAEKQLEPVPSAEPAMTLPFTNPFTTVQTPVEPAPAPVQQQMPVAVQEPMPSQPQSQSMVPTQPIVGGKKQQQQRRSQQKQQQRKSKEKRKSQERNNKQRNSQERRRSQERKRN